MIEKKLAGKVLIVDLDVHQGNGTAEIFANSDAVVTFSMHGAKNYPLHKERSFLDIALEDGTNDATYLNLLDNHLNALLDKTRPDFIFYQSGVDVLETDKLGRLSLSIAGCRQRDELVIRSAHQRKLPMVVCMGGGYSSRIQDIIEAHANTFRVAKEYYF